MVRAQAYNEARLCEECGQPFDSGRGNQFLCRQCQAALERRKRKGHRPRSGRRGSRGEREFEDW